MTLRQRLSHCMFIVKYVLHIIFKCFLLNIALFPQSLSRVISVYCLMNYFKRLPNDIRIWMKVRRFFTTDQETEHPEWVDSWHGTWKWKLNELPQFSTLSWEMQSRNCFVDVFNNDDESSITRLDYFLFDGKHR